MHPILIHLPPERCAVVGALVLLMVVSSQWGLVKKVAASTAAQAVAVAVILAVGAAIGFYVGKSWFDPKDPPAIHTFGPLVALGSFMGILWIRYDGARRGFDPEALTGLAVETLLVGVAGSRVLFILITPEVFPHPKGAPFLDSYVLQYVALWKGGLVWYGGLIPAAPFALWRARNLGLPWRTVGDIFAPAVMLGLGIGRIGCLMAGDDHGKVVESGPHWWTLTFTDKEALVSEGMKGLPLWPSQPMMSIGDFIIFGLCASLRKRFESRPIAVTLLMMTLYPILRFFIEFIRGDAVRKFLWPWEYAQVFDKSTGEYKEIAVAGLSTSQAISIPLVFLMAGMLVFVLVKPARGAEKPLPTTEKPAAGTETGAGTGTEVVAAKEAPPP